MAAPLAALGRVAVRRLAATVRRDGPGPVLVVVAAGLAALLVVGLGMAAAVVSMVAAGVGGAAGGLTCADQGGPPSPIALADIPAVALAAYYRASAATGVNWAVLAGIGQVESGQGTSGGAHLTASGEESIPIIGPALNGSGVGGNVQGIPATPGTVALDGDPRWQHAVGPMQFLAGTWLAEGRNGRGGGTPDPQNIFDAALTAAWKLRNDGAAVNLPAAIYAYNASDAYVTLVLQYAGMFARAAGAAGIHPVGFPSPSPPSAGGSPQPSPTGVAAGPPAPVFNPCGSGVGPVGGPLPPGAAGKILAYAEAQLGKPYVFGAAGPDAFDCSGLTMMAYAQVGVTLPHSSELQWAEFPHVPPGQVQPGDLVFFGPPDYDGTRTAPGHVGIVLDPAAHTFINAPHTGASVEVSSYANDPGLIGFARPVVPAGPPTLAAG